MLDVRVGGEEVVHAPGGDRQVGGIGADVQAWHSAKKLAEHRCRRPQCSLAAISKSPAKNPAARVVGGTAEGIVGGHRHRRRLPSPESQNLRQRILPLNVLGGTVEGTFGFAWKNPVEFFDAYLVGQRHHNYERLPTGETFMEEEDIMVKEFQDFVKSLTDEELLSLMRAVRTRLSADNIASRQQGARDEEEWDSLLAIVTNRQATDEAGKKPQGLTDIAKQLNEAQRVALFTLLTYLEPGERGVDWDEENPEEFDEIELARLCFLGVWPADDWNRYIYAGSDSSYDEEGRFVFDEHGYPVRNPNWENELERRAALLEEFRPKYVAE